MSTSTCDSVERKELKKPNGKDERGYVQTAGYYDAVLSVHGLSGL